MAKNVIHWDHIDQLIQSRSLLKHPFYQAWSCGELTLTDLQLYAKQYYVLETAFPQLLSRIHASCDDLTVRQGILKNLYDEEYGEDNHRELWLRFAEGLGLSREAVIHPLPNTATTRCLDTLKLLAADPNPAIGLSALYAYESQLPAISQSKINGLVDFYGINNQKTLQFFDVHKTLDQWHAEQEKSMISYLNASEKEVSVAVTKSCDALWTFLDGVEETRQVSL